MSQHISAEGFYWKFHCWICKWNHRVVLGQLALMHFPRREAKRI